MTNDDLRRDYIIGTQENDIRPEDVPRMIADLRDWYRRDLGHRTIESGIRLSGLWCGAPPDGAIPGVARAFCDWAACQLDASEAFYITGEMYDLAVHASRTVPPPAEPVMTEAPALTGLMTFGRSMLADPCTQAPPPDGGEWEGGGRPVPMIAVMWARLPAWAPFSGPGLSLVRYSDSADLWNYRTEDDQRVLRANNPRLWQDSENAASLDPSRPNWVDQNGGAVLRAIWLLMQQPFVGVATITLSRVETRRLHRRDAVKAVRVVYLRAAAKPDRPEGMTEREYRHRWIVRGHWRKQWYPSRDRHAPIWINPHLKGPDGAPLLTGEKVYAWTR